MAVRCFRNHLCESTPPPGNRIPCNASMPSECGWKILLVVKNCAYYSVILCFGACRKIEALQGGLRDLAQSSWCVSKLFLGSASAARAIRHASVERKVPGACQAGRMFSTAQGLPKTLLCSVDLSDTVIEGGSCGCSIGSDVEEIC